MFLEAWEQAGKPNLRIAVVGGGTGEALQQAGITPTFTASKALGKIMGKELPRLPGNVRASTRANHTAFVGALQDP